MVVLLTLNTIGFLAAFITTWMRIKRFDVAWAGMFVANLVYLFLHLT